MYDQNQGKSFFFLSNNSNSLFIKENLAEAFNKSKSNNSIIILIQDSIKSYFN